MTQTAENISVLMAVYNGQNTVATALHSILQQTRQADEIIIVDDGSTDETGRILQTFRARYGLRIISLAENRGFSTAINAGLGKCNGTWVARLDADDLWDANHLETLERSLAMAGDGYSLIATRARFRDGDNIYIGISSGPMESGTIKCYMMHDNPFVHSAVMFRLDTARRLGGYPCGVRWEDYGLWIALTETDNAMILDACTVTCQKTVGSLSAVGKLAALQGRVEMQQRAWRLFKRHCPLAGSISLATTCFRVFAARTRQRLSYWTVRPTHTRR